MAARPRSRHSNDLGLHLSPREKYFLSIFSISLVLVAIGFALGTTVWEYGFPATIVSFLLGLALATFSYVYLGGVRENELRIGGLKLAGTVAVVFAFLYYLPAPLAAEMNNLPLIEKGRHAEERIRTAEARATRAEQASRILDTGTRNQITLLGGTSVALNDITASEGDPGRLRQLQDGQRAFAKLLDIAHVQPPPGGLSASAEAWRSWLSSLPDNRRHRVERIAFARLTLRGTDGHSESRTVFKGEEVPIRDAAGRVETTLCIQYVLNVLETDTFEREVMIFANRRCSATEES
jgi:hypothetical protein